MSRRVEVLKAMAHEDRINILIALRDGSLNVKEIQSETGLEQTTVSQHLGKFRSLQLVETKKEATKVFYKIIDPIVLELLEVLVK